jgi:hypothetical protein
MLMLVVFPILPGKIKRVKTNKLFFDFFALWQRCPWLGSLEAWKLDFALDFASLLFL